MTKGPMIEAGTVATWGYRPDGDAQIFDLAPGQPLPEGWHASPTCMTDPALATAEAVTARAAERSRLAAAAATAPRSSAWSAGSSAAPIAPTPAPPAPRSPTPPPGFRRATPQEAEAIVQRLEDEERARRADALERYGPEAQAVAPCDRETALRDAAGPLTVPGGVDRPPSLMGWTGGPRSSLPPEVRREIGVAVRTPATVAATLAEHRHWQERAEVRAAFNPDAEPPLWIRARVLLLEERLDTLPARDRDDVLARLDWMAAVLDLGFSRAIEEDEACLTTLRQDIEGGAAPLRERAPDPDEAGAPDEPPARPQASAEPPSGAAADPPTPKPVPPSEPAPSGIDPGAAPAPVQLGQQPRTREEAREAVRALLAENEDLPDREIARRVGVSPSTVAAVRKAAQHGGPPP